ncbi:hypoxia up-regulated protein 1 [Gadus chalcogrammus]|uniref:hypoxia up-regulated protein 1 n=1 Tax=Gadus chalcogrammus TaxID=1042646 RepID=UPI0024C349C0|nr:hypoxia up-regulated protein 1 [Gadus chalcogrammus]
MRRKLAVCALFCVVLAMLPSHSASVAVMSVDLGSEWMKIAIVKPGVPMEIALNSESRRKTPIAVCLKETERLFGDNALGVSVKNPKLVYRHLQSLLGKKHDNPQVGLYQKTFPEHQLLEDPVRGTPYFKYADDLNYTPEELLGMVLNYSRGLAQDFAEQPIKDAVITVPCFFNQAERRAVLKVANMAGVKVLQLINDNTAVAINYGVFRRKDIDSTPKNIMFYDMGASSTTATIVTYQTVKTKDMGVQPQVQVRGVGFDRGLGGFELDLRLRDHLAKLFNQQKKSKKDVRENHRAMAKLLKEAQRLKMVLSANAEFTAQVEGLMDDIDFKARVSRVDFEAMCADLFERVSRPVQDALATAEMTAESIEQVILVGGSTRVPKVQEVLLKAVNKEELGKNINADEAAAMGAVYQAAALSKAFKVKPFLVRDATVYPIQVEFTRETDEDGAKTVKHNKRILFQRMAPYPQRKVITFNRYTDDFSFEINYGDLAYLGEEDLGVFGSLNLTTVKLSEVGSSFLKHTDAESKGIKAHFNMDDSGVLLLDRVESVFETIVEEKEEESTLTKLGNTISNLFGGGSAEPSLNATESVQEEEEVPLEAGKEEEEEEAEKKKKTEEEPEQPKEEQEAPKEAEGEEKEKEKEKKPEEAEKAPGEEEEAAQEKNDSDSGNDDAQGEKKEEKTGDAEAEKEAEKTEQKPQKKTKISEEIAVELLANDISDPTAEDILSSNKKLQDLTNRDLAKQERERMLNNLEAFIFETQDKLNQKEYKQAVGEEEKEKIVAKLRESSEWMDEEGYAATTKELREKLSELKTLCKALFFRVDERRKRPDRLAALTSMLNTSSYFLRSAKLIPEDDQIFTDVELKTLEKVINDTTTWKTETVAEQDKRSLAERPVLLSKDLEAKLALLDREVNYLLNKAKFAKPKAKPKAKNATSSSSEKSAKANATAEEKVIPPTATATGEEEAPVKDSEALPEAAPPTEATVEDVEDSASQSKPTDAAATESPKANTDNHVGDEL